MPPALPQIGGRSRIGRPFNPVNFLPVIARELRCESRRALNYWLRVGAALLTVAIMAITLGDQAGPVKAIGGRLFFMLNSAIFVTIWIVVPFATADCISRERREGTLGLLFLTPLTARGIVIGKTLTEILRILSFLLAMVPAMSLPFLLGGVGWRDAVVALCFDLSAVLLALGCGLAASAWARDWVRALLLAEVFSLLACVGFMVAHYVGYAWLEAYLGQIQFRRIIFPPGADWMAQNFWNALHQLWRSPIVDAMTQLLQVSTGFGQGGQFRFGVAQSWWGIIWANYPPAFQRSWMIWVATLPGIGLLGLLGAIGLAAWRIEASWRDEGQSRRQEWVAKVFCTPMVLRSALRRKMGRQLEHNPIGWLQEYAWSARLTKWGWCLGIILAECLLIADPSLRSLLPGQQWLGWLLMLSLGFSATTSFRRERESGAMELLLVTPLTEGQVIGGRLRGLWRQFSPGLAVLLVVWIYMLIQLGGWYTRQRQGMPIEAPILLIGAYVCLPVVGLWFSMRRWNVLLAWAATCAVGLVAPLLAVRLSGWVVEFLLLFVEGSAQAATPLRWFLYSPARVPLIIMAAQVTLAVVAFLRLYRELRDRRFVIH